MIRTMKLSDLIKYLVGLITIILIGVCSTRYFSNLNKYYSTSFFKIDYAKIIKENIKVANLNEEKKVIVVANEHTSRSGALRILGMELPVLGDEKNKEEAEINISEEENKNIDESKSDIDNKDRERETVELKESYTDTYKSVKIKNSTDNIKLTENMLIPNYTVKNKKDIIIYHTHTCESYTPTEENSYKASGNFRTIDMNYSVARVGKELENCLEKFGFNVTRSEAKHDYPAYSGSYSRSLQTVNSLLKKKEDTEIIFDVHRDAIGSNSNYAPTVEINGEKVAQLMFVIGTNDGGGKHPNWQNNLKFAIAVQEKANELYPGLFRNITLRSETFNQKVANAASIIEVGATGNTLEEACASMKYLAEILNIVINENG